jgi:citrate lyase beta subunit
MYVPASDERKTKKVTTLSVDTLVFDLEDGVAANQKVALIDLYSMILLRAVVSICTCMKR